MREILVAAYQIQIVPTSMPDLSEAQQIYSTSCASCHGETGLGDGFAGKSLTPEPTNFHDLARYQQRTLYGLYSTITEGVSDTAMTGYSELSEEQRWALSFLVGSMAIAKPNSEVKDSALDYKQFTNITPQQAQQQYGNSGIQAMAWLRHNPQVLFDTNNAIAFAQSQLHESLNAYQNGQAEVAYELAVEAYLEGFELIENNLLAIDESLKIQIENDMTDLRGLIRSGQPIEKIQQQINHIQTLLAQASSLLKSTSLSPEASFLSAFFILLREGLEALLLVAALAALLIKTGRRDALGYIHAGWIGALVAGGITWWVSSTLISISGASREITEGVAALTAAIVLLYVGIWLHSKTNADEWQKFMAKNIEKAMSSGTLWGIAALSFVAVYREVFETILFYQALWVQTNELGRNMIISGFASGTGLLVVIAWLMMRYSVLLPLRQFFSVSGILMFVLAIVFAGKGIAALQEAGILIAAPVNFPRIDILGIYPNLLGLAVQAGLVSIAFWLIIRAQLAKKKLVN